MRTGRGLRRAQATARWTTAELAGVVAAVIEGAPDRVWSADDLRVRLAFGRADGGPAATSVRQALRLLEERGRVERVEVWGLRGWGNTAHGYRPAGYGAQGRLTLAA